MAASTASRRTRTNDPDGMRQRVLDAAATLFQVRGYHATSMHDIRHAAGLTGGALHHHFPTKKALGLAVIEERVATAVEETWIAPLRTAPTAADGILAVFARVAAELAARGAVQGCPAGNLAIELSLADPDFRRSLHAVFENWRTAIVVRLRADLAAGLPVVPDPEEAATFIVAAYSGAMALAKVGQDPAPLRACARQIAAMLRAPVPSPAG